MSPFRLIADCQLPKACVSFVAQYGPKLLQRNLVKNFMVHLVNLYDFGLIRPDAIYRASMQLLKLRQRMEAEGRLPPLSAVQTDTVSHSEQVTLDQTPKIRGSSHEEFLAAVSAPVEILPENMRLLQENQSMDTS